MDLFNMKASESPMLSSGMQSPAGPVPAAGANPMNLISMAGMIAGALAPNKDSWQAKLGNVATQQSQTQLMADAQLKRDNDYRKFLTEALKFHTPGEIGQLANMQAGNTGFFNPANGVGNAYYPAPKGANGHGGM